VYPSVKSIEDDLDKYLYHTIFLKERVIGGLYLVEKNKTLTVEDFCIHPKYQNRGYGFQVMKALEESYDHIHMWSLVTPVYSVGNQALYKKLNYKMIGKTIEDGIDVYEYEKVITRRQDDKSR